MNGTPVFNSLQFQLNPLNAQFTRAMQEAARDQNLIGQGPQGEQGLYRAFDRNNFLSNFNSIFDFNDLVYLIMEFADEEVLVKLSMSNKKLRMIIMKNETAQDKDRHILMLQYKLTRVQQNMDKLARNINSGELIDLASLGLGSQNLTKEDQSNFID